MLTVSPPQVRNTQISLAIAGVFLVCHSVRWIPNIWELQQTGTSAVSPDYYTVSTNVWSVEHFTRLFRAEMMLKWKLR